MYCILIANKVADARVKLDGCSSPGHLRCEFVAPNKDDERFRHFLKWEINGTNMTEAISVIAKSHCFHILLVAF